ncbi:MAG TPA: hypothetical protein QF423_03505 [Candidatus Scalindua sp.]|jgi:hypothetical protein|nr:hypothetical protein [Candidatus Scalindua sp.]
MGINRLFLGAFNTKVFGEKIKEKRDPKVFDDILQEEHSKLMQVVSKMEKGWNIETLSTKYDLKEAYHLPPGE